MKDKDHLLIAQIANYYYNQKLSQQEIADKLFLSRSTVSRMLQKADAYNIVQHVIRFPFGRSNEIEESIKKRYQVKECHVLQTENQQVSFDQTVQYASSIIETLIDDNLIIGLSSGKTVSRVCSFMTGRNVKNTVFTQIKGCASQNANYKFDSPEIVSSSALKFNSNTNLIYSPLYVFSDIARKYLINDQLISNALMVAKKADVLIASVALINEKEDTIWSDYITDGLKKSLIRSGATTSIIGHFLNKDGEPIRESIEKSLIGLTLEEIKSIPNKVIVASGKEKCVPVKSTLIAGLVDTLIIDEVIGNYLK